MHASFTELFAINTPAWQLMLRGSVMYWVLFLMLRFVMRRDVGGVGIADILVLVLLADASRNAMAGEYTRQCSACGCARAGVPKRRGAPDAPRRLPQQLRAFWNSCLDRWTASGSCRLDQDPCPRSSSSITLTWWRSCCCAA